MVVSSVGHFYTNASHCVFDDKIVTGTIIYWVLIVEFVNGVSVIVILCSLYKFVMAQTPHIIMMGLVLIPFPAPQPTPLPPAPQPNPLSSPPPAPVPRPTPPPSPAPSPTPSTLPPAPQPNPLSPSPAP